jgi:hypothetical protein
VHAAALYASFRAEKSFSGNELNLEGAAFVAAGAIVRFFQRGNGAAIARVLPVDATCDVDANSLMAYLFGAQEHPPALSNIVQYVLPNAGGKLTFTDGTCDTHGRILFLAAAEASADTYHDGPVSGVALGVMQLSGGARVGHIYDEEGKPLLIKVEGICADPNKPNLVHIVVDRDDPAAASEWLEVELEGSW